MSEDRVIYTIVAAVDYLVKVLRSPDQADEMDKHKAEFRVRIAAIDDGMGLDIVGLLDDGQAKDSRPEQPTERSARDLRPGVGG